MPEDDLDHINLKRVLEGEKDAFRYFIREYQNMAYSLALSMVKNHTDAEDVVQNAFVQAYKSIRSFRKESKFSSWFYKIVVNESLKYIKRNKNKDYFFVEEGQAKQMETSFKTAEEALDLREKKALIEKALLYMKPKEALVLKMHYLHELSIKEIHESTNFSLSNVKVLLFRARKNFSKYYSILNTEQE